MRRTVLVIRSSSECKKPFSRADSFTSYGPYESRYIFVNEIAADCKLRLSSKLLPDDESGGSFAALFTGKTLRAAQPRISQSTERGGERLPYFFAAAFRSP